MSSGDEKSDDQVNQEKDERAEDFDKEGVEEEEEDDYQPNEGDLAEELIGAVREHSIIWDHTRNDFKKSRDLKNAAWKAVSRSVGKSETWCKTEWEKLRHAFTRKKKTLKGKTGQSRKKIQRALDTGYFLLMKFLDDIPNEANTSTNFVDLSDTQNGEKAKTSSQLEDEVSTAEKTHHKKEIKKATTNSSVGKRKGSNNEVEQGLLEFLKKPKNEEDEHHHFGMSIAGQLRKMDPGFAQFVKMNIQKTIYECMYPPPPPQPQNFNWPQQ